MAKSKKEQELETISQFKKWFERIDKAIKMLAVIVFAVSLVAYVATLIAGFLHLIGIISHYEMGLLGWASVILLSIGLVGTEFSAVYGVVYEDMHSSRTLKEESKRFYHKLGIHSFIEFSMYFMAFITGVANFLYTLSIIKQKMATKELLNYVNIVDIIGYNPLKDYILIDPVHLVAALLFSTIIPIIMIVQAKMQIQFLRFILKTVSNIRNAETRISGEVETIKEEKRKSKKEKKQVVAEIDTSIPIPKEFDPFNHPVRATFPDKN